MPKNPDKPGNHTVLIILSLLAFSIAGAIFLNWKALVGFVSNDLTQRGQNELQQQISRLEQDIKQLTEHPATSPSNPATVLPPDDQSPPSIDFSKKECRELDDLIQDYFSQLERQEYLNRYVLQGKSLDRFRQIADSLLTNPPIVVRETDSLFTILTNTAHFYRILGNENILMLKDILLQAGDSLESTFALFYQWSVSGQSCPDSTTKLDLPLQGLYEYAGFFLNTLGGQAYLFRRESRQRLLIKYYCLLILDRANAQIMNRHGIDIIPHLESLTREMEVVENLIYKEQYLRVLRNLQDKYQAYYQVDGNIPAALPVN